MTGLSDPKLTKRIAKQRNIALQSPWAGLPVPSLNRPFEDTSFRSHDHNHPAALQRF
ncbi:hypothetical protein [Synechococcus sp. M16CYN]|uniref:hypothetical protein n=1 Tax=Synechococcus sp. M16CYN TaxID=3103139 RepID=UPI003341993F